MTEKGKLTISRVTTNMPDEFGHISIELTDDGFKMLFRAEITLADFARLLTGLGEIPCNYKVWDRTEV